MAFLNALQRCGFASVCAILAAALGSWTAAVAEETTPLQRNVEATFVYKFAPFVDWPGSAFAAPDAPLNICVFDDPKIASAMQQVVSGLLSGAHPLAVRDVTSADNNCHILYVPDGHGADAAPALAAASAKPVLTVAGLDSARNGNTIITFVLDNGHVRFDIDDASASQRGLTISSKLLSLAHAVRGRGH